MKKVLSGLTVLFVAALYMSSCNPEEEDQLQPNNTTLTSSQQATQLLQGNWYCYKRESIDAAACEGDENETKTVNTFDVELCCQMVEFSQNEAGVNPDFGTPLFYVYSNTDQQNEYCVLNYNQASMVFPAIGYNVQPGEIYLSFQTWHVGSSGYVGGGRIVSLTNDEFVLYTLAPNPTLVYFRRTAENNVPYNVPGLSGDFILDNYKEVNAGVVLINEVQVNGPMYSFNNEIYHEQSPASIKYRGIQSGGVGSAYSLNLISAQPSGFTYEVSASHLISGVYDFWTGSSIWSSYKINTLNSTELILRDETNCDTYKEYHLTKMN
jgi:hypothetical protein